MDEFLFDTCFLSHLLIPNKPLHLTALDYVANNAIGAKYISTVTLGEIRFGLELAEYRWKKPMSQLEDDLRRLDDLDYVLRTPSKHTAIEYGKLKSALAINCCKKVVLNKKKTRWPEGWVNDITGKTLQIDENDLWIAALAVERNQIFVTMDKGIKQIQDAIPDKLRLVVIE